MQDDGPEANRARDEEQSNAEGSVLEGGVELGGGEEHKAEGDGEPDGSVGSEDPEQGGDRIHVQGPCFIGFVVGGLCVDSELTSELYSLIKYCVRAQKASICVL